MHTSSDINACLLCEKNIETEIQKRLEIINNLIILGDLDLVRVQIEKLKKMPLDEKLLHITGALDDSEFVYACQLISDYLQQSEIENSELPGLRMQVQALEISLAEKQGIKVELERQVHHFYTRYQAVLGEYILQVLDLRRQVKPEQNMSKVYQKADQEYNSYKRIYDAIDKNQVPILTPERQNEIRLAFLRASKLCHPDVVADEFKEQAELLFIDLKQAYEGSNMDRILDILSMLEKGAMAAKSSQVTDLEKLKALVVSLKGRIRNMETEIEKLRGSDTYRTLSGIQDWEQYFNTIRLSLIREIHALRARAHG